MARRKRKSGNPAPNEVVEQKEYVPSIPIPPEIAELKTIEINGKKFTPIEGVKYMHDYLAIFKDIKMVELELGAEEARLVAADAFAELIKADLFFILFFIIGIPSANRKFVIDACKEVQEGEQTTTLDIWARYHYKSSILTIAKVIQKICINPEERICIFSYTRDLAQAFLRSIKQLFENDDMLKEAFPNIFFEEPNKESPLWSVEKGIIVKREGNYKEATVEAWGLMEGMPTGRHFTGRIYDDVETMDIVNTPELIEKVKYAFDMSHNVGSEGDWHCVHGTYYHHDGLLQYIKKSKDIHGKTIYKYRVKPATKDGTASGEPVLLSQADLDKLKMLSTFASQQLCDPTPTKNLRLKSSLIKEVGFEVIPTNLVKFMTIDSAGVRESDRRDGDSWAILCVGFEPKMDDVGASNLFILDAVISPLSLEEANKEIVSMYCRNGRIRQLGVEKVGISSVEIHIVNALRARKKYISIENETLVLLRPGGINKQQRIVNALEWPLNNGKIHISTQVPLAYRERFKTEMDKFPYGKDDGIDALSYAYHMIQGYRFSRGDISVQSQKTKDSWESAFGRRRNELTTANNWMRH